MWPARKKIPDTDAEADSTEMKTASGRASTLNSAVLAAVLEAVRSCQAALETQRQIERESVAVSAMAERLHEVQRRAQELERRFEEELENRRRVETADAVPLDRLIEGMRNEMRERIGFLLDEQHVCLRQLSLQTAEDAARVDQTRRRVELQLQDAARRLEELARTVTGS